MKKLAKLNLKITAKPHAHFQALTKTPAEFKKDPAKTVGVGVTIVDIFCDGQSDTKTEGLGKTMSPDPDWGWGGGWGGT